MDTNLVNVARLTHLWMCSASALAELIEAVDLSDTGASAIGRRDALTLPLVDALNNVARGARSVLGSKAAEVVAYRTVTGDLGGLRDRLEHFDEYVQGTGRGQTRPKKDLDVPNLSAPGIRIASGSARGGHAMEINLQERDGVTRYRIEVESATTAALELSLAVSRTAGLDDERHQATCRVCYPAAE